MSVPADYRKRSRATVFEYQVFDDPCGNEHGADFCFGYGYGDRSFDALNYHNPHVERPLPRHLISAKDPLVLGNIAVGLGIPAARYLVLPPPELSIAGFASMPIRKSHSVLMWMGVRFRREHVDPWLLDEIDALEPDRPMVLKKPMTYAYGSVFSRHFAGEKYDLSADEEARLRSQMGYPRKGKPIREHILYDTVRTIFGGQNTVRHYRGRELDGLELDIWIPSKRLGIEYQGQQHYRQVDHWQTEETFDKQKQRDQKKCTLCKELKIHLLHFGPNDAIDHSAVLAVLRRENIL